MRTPRSIDKMYPHGYNGLKSGSGRPMSLDPYSSYPIAQTSYPRQPQPRGFTGSQVPSSNLRTPTSTRSSSDTYGPGPSALAPAKSHYDSKYSPRGRGTSRFGTSIQQSADGYDDYSYGASFVTDDGIYDKESEILIPRGDYQFGSVAPRTPKTPKFPPMAAEPRTPTSGRIADKYPQWKSQMLLPSATLLEKFPSDRPCCAGHDTYCVKCTPELGLLTLRRSVSDLITSSPATKHAETYTKLIGGPPYSEYKNSKIGPAPKLATKSATSITYGKSNSYSGGLTLRKTTKPITSSIKGEHGSEFYEYDDYTTGVKNKSPSAAVTPWYTRPIIGPILQASPGLRTVAYATPRASETPYGIAQARNGHPIYCILDTGAAVTTISPSILLKAFPGIKIIAHRSVIGGVGGATYNTRGRIVLNMVWTGVDGRQVMTKGEAWVAEKDETLSNCRCDVLLGLPYMRDNVMNLRWSGTQRGKSSPSHAQVLGDIMEIKDVQVEITLTH